MNQSVQIGQPAPDFTLPGDDGTPVTLSDLRGKPVILYFYPKDNTSGCTTQACGFRDAMPDITTRNAVVIGISPDGQDSHQKFKAKYDLPFVLLSDTDHQVAALYGVWGEKKMYGKTYMGILRSHFIIDEAGIVRDAQVKVSPADSVSRAVQSVQQMSTAG